jgi:hypothetical protein
MSHLGTAREKTVATPSLEEAVAKYHSRPSTQYRYEHYDPIPRT